MPATTARPLHAGRCWPSAMRTTWREAVGSMRSLRRRDGRRHRRPMRVVLGRTERPARQRLRPDGAVPKVPVPSVRRHRQPRGPQRALPLRRRAALRLGLRRGCRVLLATAARWGLVGMSTGRGAPPPGAPATSSRLPTRARVRSRRRPTAPRVPSGRRHAVDRERSPRTAHRRGTHVATKHPVTGSEVGARHRARAPPRSSHGGWPGRDVVPVIWTYWAQGIEHAPP